jgi:hypothetical protein
MKNFYDQILDNITPEEKVYRNLKYVDDWDYDLLEKHIETTISLNRDVNYTMNDGLLYRGSDIYNKDILCLRSMYGIKSDNKIARVVSRTLPDKDKKGGNIFYGDESLYEAMEEFIDIGGKIKFFINDASNLEDENKKHRFHKFYEKYKNNVELKCSNENSVLPFKNFRFIVVNNAFKIVDEVSNTSVKDKYFKDTIFNFCNFKVYSFALSDNIKVNMTISEFLIRIFDEVYENKNLVRDIIGNTKEQQSQG